ncbi:MAG: hypothetical protein AABZ15_05635 [Nitrospirota bacterium]
MKRTFLALLAVYVAWSVLDAVIHVGILSAAYAATPKLWRPMQEMKMWLMHGTVLVEVASFVLIYAWLITDKSVKTAVQYGVLFGIGSGFAMGYGSYSVMPLPYRIAFWWFLGRLVEAVVAGWIMGKIIKKQG